MKVLPENAGIVVRKRTIILRAKSIAKECKAFKYIYHCGKKKKKQKEKKPITMPSFIIGGGFKCGEFIV